MHSLLYLVHRIPFPPNKGDKIRSYHLLKYLSKYYRVFLGTFIDDALDWQYVDGLNSLCEQVYVQPIKGFPATIKSLKGLLVGQPLTLPYYNNFRMKNWVNDTIAKQKIDRIVVFSSAMAQYVDSDKYKNHVRLCRRGFRQMESIQPTKTLAYELVIPKRS